MTKEELQSVLKIPPRCIYIGKDVGWKVSDFLVDCSGYIGSINLDSLEMLKCSIAFNECKFVGKIVEKNKTYQYAFIFRQCSFQEFRLFDCLLEEEIKFDSCIFAQGVVFSDSRLNKKSVFLIVVLSMRLCLCAQSLWRQVLLFVVFLKTTLFFMEPSSISLSVLIRLFSRVRRVL